MNNYISKKITVLSVFVFFSMLFLASTSYAATCGGSTACSCNDTLNESYTMNVSLACNGTALYIANDSITLNCNGTSIIYSDNSTGYGINMSNRNNITIANCTFSQSNTSNNASHGIYAKDSSNSTIRNTTIITNSVSSYGIFVSNSTGINATNMTISATANLSYCIYSSLSGLNSYSNIRAYTYNTSSYGIYLNNTNSDTLSTFEITTSGVSSTGAQIISNNSVLSDFKIITSGNSSAGAYITGTGTSASIFNITTSKTGSSGLVLASSTLCTISSTNATTSGLGSSGIIISNSTSTTGSNIDAKTLNSSSQGVYILSSSYNNFTVMSINVTNESAFHVFVNASDLLGSAYENQMINVTFQGSGRQIYSWSNASARFAVNNTLLNPINFNRSSINFSDPGGATPYNNLSLKWYVRVNVTDISGTALENAGVNYTNQQNMTLDMGYTGSDGLTAWFIANDTKLSYDLNNTNYSAHVFYASLYGFNSNSSNSTINSSKTVNIVINDTSAPIISSYSVVKSSDSATVNMLTDENATCRYSLNNIAFGEMSSSFETVGNNHSAALTSLIPSTSYVYYALCNDTYGNNMTTSTEIRFTTSNSGGGTVSGGSSPSVSVATVTAPTFESMHSGSDYTMNVTDSSVGIKAISIQVSNDVANATISVVKLYSQPSSVVEAASSVYQWISISKSTITDSDIASAKISFTVSKAWLSSNGFSYTDVVLYRYHDSGSYDKLSATKTSESDDYYTFESVTPGFSIFAIGAEKATITTTTVRADTCGNGIREDMEECDGSDMRSLTCTLLGFESGVLSCSSSCTFDTSGCSRISVTTTTQEEPIIINAENGMDLTFWIGSVIAIVIVGLIGFVYYKTGGKHGSAKAKKK